MTETIIAAGRLFDPKRYAMILVTVPDGETEAHVFMEGKLLGKSSELEDGYLSSMMKSAEDAAIAKRIRDAGWSLAGITEHLAVHAGPTSAAVSRADPQPDPRFGPLEKFADPEIEGRLTRLETRLDHIMGCKRYGIEVKSNAPSDCTTASSYMGVNGGQGRIVINADKLFVR